MGSILILIALAVPPIYFGVQLLQRAQTAMDFMCALLLFLIAAVLVGSAFIVNSVVEACRRLDRLSKLLTQLRSMPATGDALHQVR